MDILKVEGRQFAYNEEYQKQVAGSVGGNTSGCSGKYVAAYGAMKATTRSCVFSFIWIAAGAFLHS